MKHNGQVSRLQINRNIGKLHVWSYLIFTRSKNQGSSAKPSLCKDHFDNRLEQHALLLKLPTYWSWFRDKARIGCSEWFIYPLLGLAWLLMETTWGAIFNWHCENISKRQIFFVVCEHSKIIFCVEIKFLTWSCFHSFLLDLSQQSPDVELAFS